MAISNQSNSRIKWILGLILLVAAFLAGFIPQYLSASRTADELRAKNQQVEQLQQQANLSRLRDLASLLYLEVTRKNYGLASQRASALFDLVRATMNNTSDTGLKTGLEGVLAQRDAIVAKLAKPDAGVEKDVQDLLDRLFQLTFK